MLHCEICCKTLSEQEKNSGLFICENCKQMIPIYMKWVADNFSNYWRTLNERVKK